jgi:diguanylate cyclase (GGDEF)-like protein
VRRSGRASASESVDQAGSERELAALRAHVELEARVRRALDTTDTEHEVLALVEQALVERFGPNTRVLVPDPAALRLGPARLVAPDDELIDAASCNAFRQATVAVAPSSSHFDACPHLRAHHESVSGVCVPVAAGGEVIGVVHWTGSEHGPLSPLDCATLEAVAHLAACHVLLHRSAAVEPPRTDPLTGLLNPHSIDRAVLGLVTDLVPFSLAVCVLDEFAAYNETHGHGIGDQALRVFTRCLRAAVRPDDIVGRTDLDQFTVVFPATSALDAAHALERVRENLVLALSQGEVPNFAASFGVADSNQGDSIEAITETAELAALVARSAGSNRVVVAGEETAGDLDPEE